MSIAEPNAHAAVFLSPPQYCAERGFVQAKPKPAPATATATASSTPTTSARTSRENYNGFEDDDGCPDDPDTDGDGIPDSRDPCVLEPEDKDGYLDDDGCPDLDNDLDGILDTADKCPNEPEDPDGYEDEDGCPDPTTTRTGPRSEGPVPERAGLPTQEPPAARRSRRSSS